MYPQCLSYLETINIGRFHYIANINIILDRTNKAINPHVRILLTLTSPQVKKKNHPEKLFMSNV